MSAVAGSIIAVYLVTMLGLGAIAYRYTSNLKDYILGGRQLGGAVAALSAGASDMSGWLMLGNLPFRPEPDMDRCRPRCRCAD